MADRIIAGGTDIAVARAVLATEAAGLTALADALDENFTHASAWEYQGDNAAPVLHKEQLEFHYVHPSQRSYK